MTMRDFAEIMKKSAIVGKNKVKIIRELLKAIGAEGAISPASEGVNKKDSASSPSDSTIQKWLSEPDSKPGVPRYFPNLKIEDTTRVYNFLTINGNNSKWRELRDLFKDWYDKNSDKCENFCVDIETDDARIFTVSFWKQFVSFFDSLRMWDGAEKYYKEIECEEKNVIDSVADKIIRVFEENFQNYNVYRFIPKNIEEVIDSLHIYSKMLAEHAELMKHKGDVPDSHAEYTSQRFYCKWYPNHDCFEFNRITRCNTFWELKTSEKYIRLDLDDDFVCIISSGDILIDVKYDFVMPDIPKEQSDEEKITWKQCQIAIIIAEINIKQDEDYSVFYDFSALIDGMLELNFSIDTFMAVIQEKILGKYDNMALDDVTMLLYNNIKQYRNSLECFKECLKKFRNLPKEKSEYLANKALKECFSMYGAFDDFDTILKPEPLFSELYLNEREADEVKANLRRHHGSLIELYSEICGYKK